MSEISVGQLARDNNLRSLTPDIDADEIILNVPNINRPALQLAGFFDHFDSHRVQIIGNVETAYVATLSREQKIYVFDKMFSFNIPCLVYCRNHMPDEDVLELARKYSVPSAGQPLQHQRCLRPCAALPAGDAGSDAHDPRRIDGYLR